MGETVYFRSLVGALRRSVGWGLLLTGIWSAISFAPAAIVRSWCIYTKNRVLIWSTSLLRRFTVSPFLPSLPHVPCPVHENTLAKIFGVCEDTAKEVEADEAGWIDRLGQHGTVLRPTVTGDWIFTHRFGH
ncbi:hypothetical protein [Fervidibacter sacchari]